MQKLCKNKFKQDEEIPEDLKYVQFKRFHSLQELEKLKVSVCCKPKKFEEVVDCSLQHFLDARETGHAQAS